MSTKKGQKNNCGIATALSILGDKWTLLIARDIMMGNQNFESIQQSLNIFLIVWESHGAHPRFLDGVRPPRHGHGACPALRVPLVAGRWGAARCTPHINLHDFGSPVERLVPTTINDNFIQSESLSTSPGRAQPVA